MELQIADDDRNLEQLMWNAYIEFEEHMQFRHPFEALQVFLGDPAAKQSVQPRAPLLLPANTNPMMAQNVWTAALNQALQDQQGRMAVSVPFSVSIALVESVRVASECGQEGTITAARLPSGEFQVSLVTEKSGWHDVTLPPTELPVPQPMLPTGEGNR